MKSILKKNQIMITALTIMIAIAGYLNFTGSQAAKEEAAVNSSGVESGGMYQASGEEDSEYVNGEILGMDISDEDMEQQAKAEAAEGTLTDIESLDTDLVEQSADYLPSDVAIADAGEADSLAQGTTGPDTEEIPGEAVFTSGSSISSLSNARLMKEQTRSKNKETLLEIINNTNIESSDKQEAIQNMIALTDIAEKEMEAEIMLEAKGFSDAVVSIGTETVDVCVSHGELTDAQRAQIEDIVKRKTGISGENIIITVI